MRTKEAFKSVTINNERRRETKRGEWLQLMFNAME